MKHIGGAIQYFFDHISTWKLFGYSLLASSFLQIFQAFIEKHVFKDWHMLIGLFLLWVLDNLTGTWASLKDGKFVGKLWFYYNFEKTAAYIFWIALFGILKSSVATSFWVDTILGNTAITVLMIREAISVGENILRVRPDGKLQTLVDNMKSFFNAKTKNHP